MRSVKVLVRGVVHGVFFRANTEKLARSLGVKGYVKNVDEGVEAVFQGSESSVEKMIEFCHKGPEAAEVSSVDVEDLKSSETYETFEIRY